MSLCALTSPFPNLALVQISFYASYGLWHIIRMSCGFLFDTCPTPKTLRVVVYMDISTNFVSRMHAYNAFASPDPTDIYPLPHDALGMNVSSEWKLLLDCLRPVHRPSFCEYTRVQDGLPQIPMPPSEFPQHPCKTSDWVLSLHSNLVFIRSVLIEGHARFPGPPTRFLAVSRDF
jgi:hypothetical protein